MGDTKRSSRVLESVGGGIYKRIDENRELADLLASKGGLFIDKHPWVFGWLYMQDEFLVALSKADDFNPDKCRFKVSDRMPRPNRLDRDWKHSQQGQDLAATEVGEETAKKLPNSECLEVDISDEEWREVETSLGIYRIDAPVTLIVRKGDGTHRVVDAKGIVHCYTAPETGRSVVRWKAKGRFAN